MPTIMTHAAVAACAGGVVSRPGTRLRVLLLGMIVSMLPDADVIGYHYFYIPYDHALGHRGLFHSPAFAAIVTIGIMLVFFRRPAIGSKPWWGYAIYFFAVAASHGMLDAMTNGGRGIALLAPFSNERFFLPWTPIEVSPLGIRAFFTPRGLTVMQSELIWIWLPAAMACGCWLALRQFVRRRSP